jgi:hypothetical protein
MIIAGILPMILARVLMFPIPGMDHPETPWGDNLTAEVVPYNDSVKADSIVFAVKGNNN